MNPHPPSHHDTRFSLGPAIFFPFNGFGSPQLQDDAPSLDTKEKLQKILQTLPEQQARVRGNMMLLVEEHVQTLKANARRELDSIEGEWEDDPEETERVKKEVDDMFAKATVDAKEGATSEDFEIKAGVLLSAVDNGAPNPAQADGDVEMGGTETCPKPRTAKDVWDDLSKQLLHVVEKAASEMEAYDRHAREVVNGYRQALDKRSGKNVNPAASTGPGAGILKNRNVQSPVDRNEIRRLSNGMPVVGVQPPLAARTFENTDDIARRGSHSK